MVMYHLIKFTNFLLDFAKQDSIKKQDKIICVLAHGAGAPMDSPFMEEVTSKLLKKGINVARFEFTYMYKRRQTAIKYPPNKQQDLLQCWRETISVLIEKFPDYKLFIGGKSLGGRIASMIISAQIQQQDVNSQKVKGCICLGYPFHPSNKPELSTNRTEHLKTAQKPCLILQGERDALGNIHFIKQHRNIFSHNTIIKYLTDGDHSFKPRKKSGISQIHNIETASIFIEEFIQNIIDNTSQ